MKVRLAFLITLVYLAVPAIAAEKVKPVPIFVTTDGAVNGFTDPDQGKTETVRDLQWSVAHQAKGLRIATTREAATIVLIVTSRERVTGGYVVRATMIYQGGESPLTSTARAPSGTSNWGRAANGLVAQVDDWVKENRAKLIEVR